MPPEPSVNPPLDTFSCSPADAAAPPADVPPFEPSGFPSEALEPGPHADNASQTIASDDALRRADLNPSHATIVSAPLEPSIDSLCSLQGALLLRTISHRPALIEVLPAQQSNSVGDMSAHR